MAKPAAFDEFKGSYDDALQRGLSLSGESKEFFADGRLRWLRGYLDSHRRKAGTVLDYGCGTGYATVAAPRLLGATRVVGVDESEGLLADATDRSPAAEVSFMHVGELQPEPAFDLAFCNGVFHHIAPADRPAAIEYVRARIRPGGLFALYENNPWNPGTRLVMKRVPFDRDAIPLSSLETRRLLLAGGFRVLKTVYLFYFPRWLAPLRSWEKLLTRFPLGAQYCVVAARS